MSAEATPALVTLVSVDDDRLPTLGGEALETDCWPVSYTVTVSDFGKLNGAPLTSATISLSAYTDAAKTQLVSRASSVVSVKDAPATVSLTDVVRGESYVFVAEVRTAEGLASSLERTVRAPIGTAA